MAVTLQITNAAGASLFVSPENVSLPQSEINLPQALNATFISNLDVFEDETSDANAVQLRATVLMVRDGVQEFEGSITFKNISKIGEGEWLISISCLDRLADGQRSRASQSGSDNWEIESASSSTGSQTMLRTRLMVREPFNDPIVRFLPNINLSVWASGSPVWEDLIQYNSSPLNQTRYTDIQIGSYTINSATPSGGDTDLAIDATGLPNIDDEFIIGELMLVKGTDESEYVPFVILSNSGITANVLTIQVEGSVTLPGTPKALPLTLELTSDQNGIFPGGLGLIDDEPIWFDGYDITDAGNYMVRRMRRGSLTLQDRSVLGVHQAINSYDAAKSGSDVLITNGNQFDIQVSQNALFKVGVTVTLWLSNVQQGGNFTVATTAWSSPVATITTVESLPASIDEIRTQNRFINIRPQRIAKGEFVFEGNDGGRWNNITEKQFQINLNDGYPETTLNSIILGSRWDGTTFMPASSWRATYNYYPEATASSVSDIIEAVAGESIANGGWGLSAGEIEASDLTDKITKADNSAPVNTIIYFEDFFTNLGLMGNENIIGHFWDSANSKWTVKRLLQGSPVNSYSRIMSIARDLVTDEVSSGLMVKYQLPAPVNFAAINLWAATDDGSLGVYPANGVAPIAYGILPNGVREWDYRTWGDVPSSNRAAIIKKHATFPASLMLDGLTNSAYALEYGNNPPVNAPDSTTGAQFFVWMDEPGYYSGQACGLKTIKRVKIVLQIERWSNINVYAEPSIDIEVIGYSAFTSPNAQDAGGGTDTIPVANPANEVKLLGLKYLLPSQNKAFSQEVTLEADNINLNLAAVGLKFNKGPTDKSNEGVNVQLKVKEIIVEESTDRSLFVAITNTPADGSSTTLYAPKTYTKLVNPTHLVSEPVDLGVVSTGAAISLARSILLQRLVLEDSREFEIDIKGLPLPRRMDTQNIFTDDPADTYTGVVLSRGYELVDGLETCVVLLRNLAAPLIS